MPRAMLFDLYARGSQMILWFLMESGERLRLVDNYFPEVYVSGPDRTLEACLEALDHERAAERVGWTDKRFDFWTGKRTRVFELRVLNAETWQRRLTRLNERFPALNWYNADLIPEQTYCYSRDLFPLMDAEIEHDGMNLLSICSVDDRWLTDYPAPPLRIAELTGTGALFGANAHLTSLTLAMEGHSITWDEPDPREMLAGLQHAIDREDPDVLITSYGDSHLFPLLYTLAQQTRTPLRLDREPEAPDRKVRLDGRSYFSYGRILYQAPEYPLYGRWHLDRKNSFTLAHDGLDGLYEVARLARIPVQRIGRRSIGTGITSIQLDLAWREGYLVPWKKTYPEAWKTARQLLKTDRGGLVYAPETGFYENVVELDFISMYPTIMSRFNVSPETVNCQCCKNDKVPEIGYTICEKRPGLVSRSLGPIIQKRVRYKLMRKAAKERGDAESYNRADKRQDALKWMLVCCFGYLGYRNARFGRIEAHESVSAYSRELLTVAREVCEANGWHMIHANVDCVWIVKPGFRDEELALLCEKVTAATNLPIALEGIYRWMAFLPSRQVKDRPVPTRYFGAFRDGSLKYRGIECRRGDLPPFIKEAQLSILQELAQATGTAEYRAMVPALLERVAEMEAALWRGEVPIDQLILRSSLSQAPDEYSGSGRQALAARQSIKAGMNLHAGEAISYLITSAKNADKDRRVRLTALIDSECTPDPVAYIELLRRAMNTLLWPAGVELDEVKIVAPWDKAGARTEKKMANAQLELF